METNQYETGTPKGPAPAAPRSAMAGRAGKIAAGVLAGVTAFYGACTTYVPPGEQAVRQVDISPLGILGPKGIQHETYTAGIHRSIPVFERLHKLPRDVLVLNMNRVEQKEDFTRGVKPALIQTSDGFFVTLDCSILYRITDPYKVVTTIGAGRLYEDNGIIPRTEPVLKETLGKLEPEDFYNVEKRVPQQEKARDRLNELLAAKGITVDHVLIRYPQYDPQVQEKIANRKLQDQLVFTQRSQAAEKEANSQFMKLQEEGNQAAMVKLESGKAYVTEMQGKIDAYVKIRASEGDRLLQMSEAEKKRLINKSYEGAGSDLLVGLEMAKNLSGLEAVITTVGGQNSLNPLDTDKTADTLSGRK